MATHFFLQYGDREASSLSQALYPIIPRFFDGIEVVPSLLHGDLWGGNAAQISDSPGMLLASTSKACSKHHVSRLHIKTKYLIRETFELTSITIADIGSRIFY